MRVQLPHEMRIYFHIYLIIYTYIFTYINYIHIHISIFTYIHIYTNNIYSIYFYIFMEIYYKYKCICMNIYNLSVFLYTWRGVIQTK
jgi:hypothetical protein